MGINEAKKTAQFNLLVCWALTEHLRRGKIIFEKRNFFFSFFLFLKPIEAVDTDFLGNSSLHFRICSRTTGF